MRNWWIFQMVMVYTLYIDNCLLTHVDFLCSTSCIPCSMPLTLEVNLGPCDNRESMLLVGKIYKELIESIDNDCCLEFLQLTLWERYKYLECCALFLHPTLGVQVRVPGLSELNSFSSFVSFFFFLLVIRIWTVGLLSMWLYPKSM